MDKEEITPPEKVEEKAAPITPEKKPEYKTEAEFLEHFNKTDKEKNEWKEKFETLQTQIKTDADSKKLKDAEEDKDWTEAKSIYDQKIVDLEAKLQIRDKKDMLNKALGDTIIDLDLINIDYEKVTPELIEAYVEELKTRLAPMLKQVPPKVPGNPPTVGTAVVDQFRAELAAAKTPAEKKAIYKKYSPT